MIDKKLSIITACYNEEKNIMPLYERVMGSLSGVVREVELIYGDDGSYDGSEALYRDLCRRDRRVKVILMSRNFCTSQTGFFAGMAHATGDAVVLLDGDLQDPPEVIPRLIEKWQEGFDVVYGVRVKRKASVFMQVAYKAFYRLFRKLSYIPMPVDAGDFSLMSRRVVDEIVGLPEHDLRIRGLRAFVGFRQTGVEYERDARHAGKAYSSFLSNIRFAKDLIVNFSYKPLSWVSGLALLTMAVAFVVLFINLVFHFLLPSPAPRGVPTIVVVVLFLGGVQLLSLAVIGEYLTKIFEEAKGRPRYIVREIINGEEK